MKRYIYLTVALSLWVYSCGNTGVDEEYGPNHALVSEGGVTYKQDCLECHKSGGQAGERIFLYAGTVWNAIDGENTLSGVKVVIKSTTTNDSIVLTTDQYGNFYYPNQEYVTPTDPIPSTDYIAYVVSSNGTIQMQTKPTYGGCNSCHIPNGAAGGKLYAP